MKSLDSNVRKSGTDYNPAKYVRGYRLLHGVNVNELPNVQDSKKIEKYSYEEYLKSKNPNQNIPNKKPMNTVTNVNQPNPRNEVSPNKYSYEQYKMKKQLNKSGDNIISQDDYNKSSSSFNKINLNSDTPPTSSYINNNPHNFLNFDLTKQNISQTTLLTPVEDTQKGEQIKDPNTFNPYSILTFDMTPQQPKTNYGGSYMPSSNNDMYNRANINPQANMQNMNYSNIQNRNFNMPNYNNGYSQNNYNMNNPGNLNPSNLNFNNNNPGNIKFPK